MKQTQNNPRVSSEVYKLKIICERMYILHSTLLQYAVNPFIKVESFSEAKYSRYISCLVCKAHRDDIGWGASKKK